MYLKNARTCKNCLAYEESRYYNNITGYCQLGFKTEPKSEVGFMYGKKELWGVECKPAEPCPKPTRIKSLIECQQKYCT